MDARGLAGAAPTTTGGDRPAVLRGPLRRADGRSARVFSGNRPIARLARDADAPRNAGRDATMIDDHDVREMLQRRADTVPATPVDTPTAVRRARRRLVLNGAVATVAAAAI